ncbi:hypothetical protein NDN08_008371 [Rhodosorus marinus]|uniref:Autophagy-related protein 9 n=1 Tax=Rhodosorus marinus TaxID=101924 RepID=A0AAV8V087_9RHOD|nr:hypothetical protein NDN08_008371 [Rhodosorus marinus]
MLFGWHAMASESQVGPDYGSRWKDESEQSDWPDGNYYSTVTNWERFVNSFETALADYHAHGQVVWQLLLTFDLLFYCCLITTTTLYCYYYGTATNLGWTFISFIVVFPITWNISEAYKRRESALVGLARFKSLALNIYFAHRDWACPNSCKTDENILDVEESSHQERVRQVLNQLSGYLGDYLLVPCTNNTRHLFTSRGSRERERLRPLSREYRIRILKNLNRLSLAVEVLKARGLPATEASRVNQYNEQLCQVIETMRNIKSYRTPEGLRAFARLFIFIHAIFYGSYYAYLAKETTPLFALSFAYLLGGAMIALLNVEAALEDPFDPRGLDNVRVQKKIRDLQAMMKVKVPSVEHWIAPADLVDVPGHALASMSSTDLQKLQSTVQKSLYREFLNKFRWRSTDELPIAREPQSSRNPLREDGGG